MVVSKNTTRTDTLVADLTALLDRNRKGSALYGGKVLGDIFDHKEIMQSLVMYIQERDHQIRLHTMNFYSEEQVHDPISMPMPIIKQKRWWEFWKKKGTILFASTPVGTNKFAELIKDKNENTD